MQDFLFDGIAITEGMSIKFPKQYEIDFDKVRTLEDIKTVLMALNIKMYDDYIVGIEHLVKEVKREGEI